MNPTAKENSTKAYKELRAAASTLVIASVKFIEANDAEVNGATVIGTAVPQIVSIATDVSASMTEEK